MTFFFRVGRVFFLVCEELASLSFTVLVWWGVFVSRLVEEYRLVTLRWQLIQLRKVPVSLVRADMGKLKRCSGKSLLSLFLH